jgi:predicted DNA-binding transcriptional regulator AlpA
MRADSIGPPYIKISARCVRYRREDVLRWLESRRVKPAHEVNNGR